MKGIPYTPCTVGWVGPTANLDILEKRFLVPARKQTTIPRLSAHSPFTALNELSCLLYDCVFDRQNILHWNSAPPPKKNIEI
jgi:hypothetical protein